jgi:hypothetical protein
MLLMIVPTMSIDRDDPVPAPCGLSIHSRSVPETSPFQRPEKAWQSEAAAACLPVTKEAAIVFTSSGGC